MHLFDDSHAHTARCWWDCDEANWVARPSSMQSRLPMGRTQETPGRFGDHIAGIGGRVA